MSWICVAPDAFVPLVKSPLEQDMEVVFYLVWLGDTLQGQDRNLSNEDRRRHILLAIVHHDRPHETCRPVTRALHRPIHLEGATARTIGQ